MSRGWLTAFLVLRAQLLPYLQTTMSHGQATGQYLLYTLMNYCTLAETATWLWKLTFFQLTVYFFLEIYGPTLNDQ